MLIRYNLGKWLSISLFASKKNYGPLIRNGIIPFLSTFSKKMKIQNYEVMLSNNLGSHIRIALYIKGNPEMCAYQADLFFSSFFEDAGFDSEIKSLDKLIHPFQNTVLFGIYVAPNYSAKKLLPLSKAISTIVLKTFEQDDNVSSDDILILAFYLQASLSNTMLKVIPLQSSTLHMFYTNIFNSYKVKDIDVLIKLHKQHSDQLQGILAEVMHEDLDKASFLNDWVYTCTEFFNSYAFLRIKEHNYLSFSEECFHLIAQHLGLSNEMKMILSALLLYSFSEQQEQKT